MLAHETQNHLCGFGGRFHSTESLWCIGSKVCWANGISHSSLCSAAGNVQTRTGSDFLLTGRGFNFASFSGLTGIAQTVAKAGTGLSILVDHPEILRQIAYNRLRYCRPCLAQGIHSILFQLPLFRDCPQCGRPLLDRCYHCGAFVSYEWPSTWNLSFRCSACGIPFWAPRQELFHEDHIRDSLYDELTRRSSDWARNVLLFSGCGEQLREWIGEGHETPIKNR